MRTPTLLALSLSPTLLAACGDPGCLTGREDCVVAPACEELTFTCDDGFSEVWVLQEGDPVPIGGLNALAAPGDLVLANEQVVAVIDALDHPHYVAPTGGTLLDLGRRGKDDDALRNLQQAIGVLPGDAFHYTEVEVVEEGDVKAVQLKGTLDGFPDVRIATRYEIRPCDPGIRIRTELASENPDPLPMWLIDGFYWGDREHLPFTPGPGFEHPSFGLTDLQTAFRDVPWMVGAAHAGQAASYGLVSCSEDTVRGFQSREISAVGVGERILQPGGWQAYDRFVTVGRGPSVSTAADLLLNIRQRLFGEPVARISGRLVPEDGSVLGDMVRASVLVTGEDGLVTHVVPQEDGGFDVSVPGQGRYALSVEAFGEQVAVFEADLHTDEVDLGDLSIPGVGTLTIDVNLDGAQDQAMVLVHPADDATMTTVSAALYDNWEACAPLLGNPWGASPACNRVLVNGPTTVRLPPGVYEVYATAGPFTSLGHVGEIVVDGGTGQSVLLELQTLPLQPEGTLSADFHVHGRASFDSSIPDVDRVKAFLAARVDVVASTDHDVVNDYAAAMAELDAYDRMTLLVGLETTGHVLWPLVDETYVPKVIGHFNFWPVPYDPEGPWRGAPWDELAEPGELFTRVEQMGWPRETGVIQLNHPWGGLQFGRDFAWPTAIGLDLTKDLPEKDDGTGQGMFLRTPQGAAFSNADYHAQEVMNGSNNAAFLQYRAIWHYLLDQGVVRAGTANSDSHSLTDNVLGTPRTLVWTDTTVADFDPVAFNRAVREGRMSGTNGPILEVALEDGDTTYTPSTLPITPGDAATLTLKVSAAPWVPVRQVRVLVNGEVVRTFDEELPIPDPFGTAGLLRLDTTLPLADLLPASGDAWVVVEAGMPLVENADLDCNGVPDTGDNNGDGTIDWRDVEELTEDPEVDCLDTVGPLGEPQPPQRGTPLHTFSRVVPGGYPASFTNPLLIDRDGDGFSGVSR